MLQPINKIEITPMVGVALILVIIFVVTSPLIMSPSDMNLELPRAVTVHPDSEGSIMVTYTKEGEVAIDEAKIPKGVLRRELQKRLKQDADKLVVIRADRQVLHKDILALLSAVKRSGARNIAIATQQKSRLNR